MDFSPLHPILDELKDCTCCPRNCHANRFSSKLGYCKSDASFNISSICIHRGEEPVISGKEGICNIFFAHCNLQCIYCQNHQISSNLEPISLFRKEPAEVIKEITRILDKGISRVGFVSPSHHVPHVKFIIEAVTALGYNPVWVFNTNGYDKVETLKSLEGMIDLYLPDFKYLEKILSDELSDAPGYPEIASKALIEMFRQKGAALHLREDDTAESGIIVRHLVLPGHVENSKKVLQFIAEEISSKIHISLMSQYYPPQGVAMKSPLSRQITREEYQSVIEEMERLGMHHGWIQELESAENYRPDFQKEHPFE